MIEFAFTLDYEIYGNGAGSLRELVYEPGERLREIFRKWDARLVNFVEVAELEKIAARGTDEAIGAVERQVRQMYLEGHEIALHLHPQWCNAVYEQGRWVLDSSEYNLCTLPEPRIAEIITGSLRYMRHLVGQGQFTPLSFRAGNWLFQPTRSAARVMAGHGIRVDSSVFKGGVQHARGLDYRRALHNGDYWPFSEDASVPDPEGCWMEVPIYTEMVAPWRMATKKRLGMNGSGMASASQSTKDKISRLRDLMRPRYPLKMDFCRMTLGEMISMMDGIIRRDTRDPGAYRPIVAIGHTKDLIDLEAVDGILSYLHAKGIAVATFEAMLPKLTGRPCASARLPHVAAGSQRAAGEGGAW